MAMRVQTYLDRACRRLRNNDRTLRRLDLYNNQISDEGATALAQAMKGNTTLQELSLIRNKITDAGATALALAMEGNTTLQTTRIYADDQRIKPSDKPKDTAAHDGEIAPYYDNKPKDTAAHGGEIAPFYDNKRKDTAAHDGEIAPFYDNKPKDTAAHDGEIAPFYDNLIKLDGLDVNAATRLLFELSSFIDGVP